MPWNTTDLSAITAELIARLATAFSSGAPVWKENGGPIARFDVSIAGALPQPIRGNGGCQLSLCLLHATHSQAGRNAPAPAAAPPRGRVPGLALDLHYLLTACAKDNHVLEQQAMGIALRCFHETPILTRPADGAQLTLAMETGSIQEQSQLWQGLCAPMRLSALYRVGGAVLMPGL